MAFNVFDSPTPPPPPPPPLPHPDHPMKKVIVPGQSLQDEIQVHGLHNFYLSLALFLATHLLLMFSIFQ